MLPSFGRAVVGFSVSQSLSSRCLLVSASLAFLRLHVSGGLGEGRLQHAIKSPLSGRRLTPRSRRRAAVAGPPLPRLGSRDATRRASGTERPHAPERRNVSPSEARLSTCRPYANRYYVRGAASVPIQ